MEPIPNEAWKSTRRALRRERVLVLLSSLGEAYVGQLAGLTGYSAWTIRCLLHGRPPYYAVELALVPLGLVRERPTPRGRAYEITTRGRRKARSLTAGKARRAQARARAHAPEWRSSPADASPVAGAGASAAGVSATWSVDGVGWSAR